MKMRNLARSTRSLLAISALAFATAHATPQVVLEDDVSLADSLERAGHPRLLHPALGYADAGGVGDDHRHAAKIETHFDHVARGAGLLRNDGDVAPG